MTSPTPAAPSAPTPRAAWPGRDGSEHDRLERRIAARALLRRPVLSAQADREDLARVRRHARALKATFDTTLGYQLVVETSFARLIKAPLPEPAAARPAYRRSGVRFNPRTYAYLALVCAGLLAADTGEQVLISQLVERLRLDAATADIPIDDSISERRAVVAAIEALIDMGVLAETDGTVAGWGEHADEALLTVNQALLPQLLTRALHPLTGPGELLSPDPIAPDNAERSLRRKLVENPLVRREDLCDTERDVLSRNRKRITDLLWEAFGLSVEVRAEGALAFDADEVLSDVPFPGPGTVRQAALLLLDHLIEELRPTATTTYERAGTPVPGAFAPWALVDEVLASQIRRHGRAWRTAVTEDPLSLRDDAIAVLAELHLVEVLADGIAVHPAAARYRPEPHRAPARTRARRRLDGQDRSGADSPPAVAGPSLFDSPSSQSSSSQSPSPAGGPTQTWKTS